ncbi:hypothetical protein D3C81_2197020 [compost metagenome]
MIQQDETAHLGALGDQSRQIARTGRRLRVIVAGDGAAQDDPPETGDVGDPRLERFTADIVEE